MWLCKHFSTCLKLIFHELWIPGHLDKSQMIFSPRNESTQIMHFGANSISLDWGQFRRLVVTISISSSSSPSSPLSPSLFPLPLPFSASSLYSSILGRTIPMSPSSSFTLSGPMLVILLATNNRMHMSSSSQLWMFFTTTLGGRHPLSVGPPIVAVSWIKHLVGDYSLMSFARLAS